jgi:thiamine biosynthesis lipoprotein
MGTLVSISAIVDSPERADHAAGCAFEEMDRLIALFSLYDHTSALTRLNESGRLDGAPPELTRVARAALDYHRISGGAFEMTVGPVVDLFRDRSNGGPSHLPTRAEVGEAMERVGSQHVRVSRRRIRFERDGMAATFDGIAKGDIVDAIARILDRHGLRRYLVNGGGDIRVRGTGEGGLPWTVAVRDPASPGLLRDTIQLTDGSVATSGGYENHFDNEMINHHIVDARTGQSPVAAASVSVVAPTAVDADALATTVFVLGPAQGVAFVDRIRAAACLVIDRQDRRWTSRRWRSESTPGGEHQP